MNIRENEVHALRTIKPHDSKALAIADWGLGLGGELGEVVALLEDRTMEMPKMEFTKEVGDILWYAVALAKELGIHLPDDTFRYESAFSYCTTCDDFVYRLTMQVGIIQEKVKHTIMHREATNFDSFRPLLMDLISGLRYLLSKFEIGIGDCAILNAAKLAHRYNTKNGGKYSHEASANRHEAEVKFEDTATYKMLLHSITGETVNILPTDVEVL
jgi:NTP pyrophosphatase (non-canonical NTP hydrolase)